MGHCPRCITAQWHALAVRDVPGLHPTRPFCHAHPPMLKPMLYSVLFPTLRQQGSGDNRRTNTAFQALSCVHMTAPLVEFPGGVVNPGHYKWPFGKDLDAHPGRSKPPSLELARAGEAHLFAELHRILSPQCSRSQKMHLRRCFPPTLCCGTVTANSWSTNVNFKAVTAPRSHVGLSN